MLHRIEGEKEEFLPVGIQNPYCSGVTSENGSKYWIIFQRICPSYFSKELFEIQRQSINKIRRPEHVYAMVTNTGATVEWNNIFLELIVTFVNVQNLQFYRRMKTSPECVW